MQEIQREKTEPGSKMSLGLWSVLVSEWCCWAGGEMGTLTISCRGQMEVGVEPEGARGQMKLGGWS